MPGSGAQPGKCYIGTSGWSYSDWAKGRFYPRGLKQGEWLRYFAERFGTVEVNASFYRLPRPEMISRWHSVTGPRFRFAVKLWRRITQVAADASRVRRWLQDGRNVFVYYNNDIGGHAIDNARQLIDQVSS